MGGKGRVKRPQLQHRLTFSAILLTVSSLMTVELLSEPLRGTISAFQKSRRELEWLQGVGGWNLSSLQGSKKLTRHFVLIRHLPGQLLHGDVVERTHDDDGPFETGCRHKRLTFIEGMFSPSQRSWPSVINRTCVRPKTCAHGHFHALINQNMNAMSGLTCMKSTFDFREASER